MSPNETTPRLRRIDGEGGGEEPERRVAPDAERDVYDVPFAVRRRRPFLPQGRAARVDVGLRLLLLLGVSAAAGFVVGPKLVGVELPSDESFLGKPARVHVRADRDYALVDEKATEVRRELAHRQSRSVWDLDLARAQADARVLATALDRLREALKPFRTGRLLPGEKVPALPRDAAPVLDAERARLAGEIALLGAEAPRDDAWDALVKAVWRSPEAADIVTEIVADALFAPIVGDRALLARDERRGIVVRPVPASLGRGERIIERIEEVRALSEAREAVAQRLARRLSEPPISLRDDEARAVARFAGGLLRKTLTYNASESEARRQKAAEAVRPEVVRVLRGEMVLRPGEIIQPRHLLVLKAMEKQQGEQVRTRAALGSGAFVLLLCFVVYRLGVRGVFRRELGLKDIIFLAGLLLFVLIAALLADRLSLAVTDRLPGIPTIATRLVLSADVALLFALLAALLGGVMAEPGTTWIIMALVSSMAGAALVASAKRRSSLLVAGLAAGVVGGLAATTLEVFRGALSEEQLFWLASATGVGGLLSGLLLLLVTPLVEGVFGYVTDLTLVALADLNQPLLKDLIVHAPGTWHHSMRVARLAESAARAVGANPNLARVMSLYHDVGKIKAPSYFSENLQGRNNPHDKMPPEQSAEVLKEHVAHGVELARRHRLPRVVTQAIEEHHADLRIEYFYEKARAATGDGDAEPDDAAYRYDGPLPRLRESAIVMLADQIEAASRALGAASPERLGDVVDYFIRRALAEEALAASELTFQDLERVREALHRTLVLLSSGSTYGGDSQVGIPAVGVEERRP